MTDGPVTHTGPATFANRADIHILNLKKTTATIDGGAIAFRSSLMVVDTEGGGASDNLDNITGGKVGDILVLFGADPVNRGIVVRNSAPGNIRLDDAGDFTMSAPRDNVTLIRVVQPATSDDVWNQISESS